MTQNRITKVFTDRSECFKSYEGRCKLFPYKKLNAGETFHDGYNWLLNDYTALWDGMIYQIATAETNCFVEFVFILD